VDSGCTMAERTVIYHGLEQSFPGTHRHSVEREVNTAGRQQRNENRERETKRKENEKDQANTPIARIESHADTGSETKNDPIYIQSDNETEEERHTWSRPRTKRKRRHKPRRPQPEQALHRAIVKIEGYDTRTARYEATIRTNAATAERWGHTSDDDLWTTIKYNHTLIYTGTDIWQCNKTNKQQDKIEGIYLLTQTPTSGTMQDLKTLLKKWGTQTDRAQQQIQSTTLDAKETAPPQVIQDFWDGERRRGRYPPVEIESRLLPDWRWRHLKTNRFSTQPTMRQEHITDSDTSEGEREERETWLPEELTGTKRLPAITCQTIRR